MRPIKPGKEQDKLEQHFREQLRNMEVTPPASMWDRVEEDLDQQRKKIKYDHWYYALLILLLPLTVTNLVVNHNIKGYYKQFLTEKKREELFGPKYNLVDAFPSQLKHLDKIYERTISQPLNMDYVEDMPYENFSPIVAAGKQHISPYIASLNQDAIIEQERNIAAINDDGKRLFQHSRLGNDNGLALGNDNEYTSSGKIKLQTLSAKELNYNTDYNLPAYNKRYYKRAARRISPLTLPKIAGFYAGIDAGTGGQLILLRHSYYPFIAMDPNYGLRLSYNYGVKLGYNFNQHFGIEAEWLIRSGQESEYDYLYGGKIPVRGDLHLTYTQIPVVAKYKFSRVSRLTGQPVSFNLLAGVIYGHLQQVDMTSGEANVPSSSTSKLFASNQLGFTAGMDYDIFIDKYLFFTIGCKSGIITDVVPNGKPNSYGLMLGVNAGLNFQFPELKRGSVNTTIAEP